MQSVAARETSNVIEMKGKGGGMMEGKKERTAQRGATCLSDAVVFGQRTL